MIRKVRLSFWFIVARFFDWYAYILIRLWLLRKGICDRKARFSREDILKATNLSNPRGFFDYFSRGKSYDAREEVKECGGGLRCDTITFASPFPSTMERNNTVQAALYRHRIPTDLVIIFLGTSVSSFDPFEHWMARTVAEQGIDCCLLELPWNHNRSHHRGRSCFVTGDPVATAESLIQAAMDADRLYEILQGRYHYNKIGLVGLSIGGSAAHVSTFLRPYVGAVAIIMGAPPANMVWQARGVLWSRLREGFKNRGYTFGDIEKLWAMSDTTRYHAPNFCPKFLLMAGLFDNFASPRLVLQLSRAMPNHRIIWYPGSHYGAFLFVKPAIENIVRFFRGEPLKDTGLKPRIS